ncbi:rhodanese-like domain-containing protein [Neptunomonas japonica]|uniref:Sulfurtransferase n=1 Tax=Neptunomonas japonica JAMM 1380 TaxID=1441457 RepID=A0A7R6PTJ5_9GAMM|nr:rhodanese-like domain-containing protein [Neptunomonas japonica]BBB29203.1 sulfurtransferase [Neptunomonas japonica JAMM 1380]
MFIKTISSVALVSLLTASPLAFSKDKPKAMIAPGLFSFEVMHDGAMVEIKRNQNPENLITDLYATTFRGMPQAMHPFEPYDVETIAEREFVQYMIDAQKNKNILIVDTRTIGWHQRLTIPGAVSYPYTMMDDADDRDWAMDDFGALKQSDGGYDFTKAKTLAMFCNGYWCGQTPSMVRAMLEHGYPAEKIKYYRGGMQAWTSLGLSVVGEATE